MSNKSPDTLLQTVFVVVMALLCMNLSAQNINEVKKINLNVRFVDKDSSFKPEALKHQISFDNKIDASAFPDKLKTSLIAEGYYTASVDSAELSDSVLYIVAYAGEKFDFILRESGSEIKSILLSSGIHPENILGKKLNYQSIQSIQQKVISQLENSGYPFASVSLDSVAFENGKINASLKIDKGVYYVIDSIRILGEAAIDNKFLQRYLNIKNNSAYNAEALRMVDPRLRELPYVTSIQNSDLTMLGSGAILNTYLKARKSSQFYVLAGIQPSAIAGNKSQLTADVNLDLKNLFGSGENILFKWQQLQTQSPRLNMGFVQPYIFNSGVGTEFLFDLFKKDSSFLQLNALIGFRYSLSTKKTLKIYMQWRRFNLLEGGIDTTSVIAQKMLPPNIDMNSTSAGLEYEWDNTDYKYNPRKGNQITLNAQLGVKNIRRNNEILSIKDASFNYGSLYDSIRLNTYNLKITASASHFFPVGKNAVLKASCNLGYFNSPTIFRNELFQIGGYRLLRGFDEESIYATSYAVITGEYRLLLSQNSYLSFFSDAGKTNFRFQSEDVQNSFLSAGIGILYETKAGILNLSYALGKRNDLTFDFRSASKIHFGYINYF